MIEEKIKTTKIEDLVSDFEVHVDSDDNISSAIGKMKKFKLNSIPIFEDGEYSGMLPMERIMSFATHPKTTKCKKLMIFPPVLNSKMNLPRACNKMWRNKITTVAVADGDCVLGILDFWDIIDWCLKNEHFKKVKISELYPKKHVSFRLNKKSYKKKRGISGCFTYFQTDVDFENLWKKIPYIIKQNMDLQEEVIKKIKTDSQSTKRILRVELRTSDSIHELFLEIKEQRPAFVLIGDKIVTCRDILKYLSTFRKKGGRITFVNKTSIDGQTKKYIKHSLNKFVSLYDKKNGKDGIKGVMITICDLSSYGDRENIELSLKVITNLGVFCTKRIGRNPVKVFNGLVDTIEKQIIKRRCG